MYATSPPFITTNYSFPVIPISVAAFALSSGTIGAALSSSLSKLRSIAVSYGTVDRPVKEDYFEPAHALASRIVRHLWENWGIDEGGIRNSEVDLYNINIPMIEGLLSEDGLPIAWTRMWRNSYGRLFKRHVHSNPATSRAGPDSLNSNAQGVLTNDNTPAVIVGEQLVFRFSPSMEGLINPDLPTVPVGSDGWAIGRGWASVTPLRACFAEPAHEMGETPFSPEEVERSIWKVKL